MHALVILLCISQHTKFEVPSFNDSRYHWGPKFKKTGHVTLTSPLVGSLSSHSQHLIYTTYIQNLATLAVVVSEILLRASKLNVSCDSLTS